MEQFIYKLTGALIEQLHKIKKEYKDKFRYNFCIIF